MVRSNSIPTYDLLYNNLQKEHMNNNEDVEYIDTAMNTIVSRDATKPLFVRIAYPSQPIYAGSSPMASQIKVEEYIMLSALPVHLREKVVTAIKAQMAQ